VGGAAKTATSAANQANASNQGFINNVYGNTISDTNPYVSGGATSQNALLGLLGLGGNPQAANAAFQKYLGSTNYGFQLQQGENAIEYANAPSFNSGATAKALNNYAQGMAGNALAGYENLLSGQEGYGLQGSQIRGQVGASLASPYTQSNLATAGQVGNAAALNAGGQLNALNNIAGLVSGAASQSSFGQGGNALSGINIGGSSPQGFANSGYGVDPNTGAGTQFIQ
jgi:hypothetical protein